MFLGSESKLSVPWLDVFLEGKLLMGALMAELLATGEADCPSLRKPPLSGNYPRLEMANETPPFLANGYVSKGIFSFG